MHHRVPALIDDFLELKCKYGTAAERTLYAGKTREWFVTRLLTCRPLVFFNPDDTFLLKTGQEGSGGFTDIGTSRERAPLVLSDYLSYDEMAISALVNVAVPTHFFNRGGRFNQGVSDLPGEFERDGVYVACVGARFEVPGRMEWQTVMVTPQQNTRANGYGAAPTAAAAASSQAEADETLMKRELLRSWARLYGCEALPTVEEARARSPSPYLEIGGLPGALFDAELYQRRLRLTIEPFLIDANARAAAAHTRAYVHVVGLGIGAWMVDERQAALMTDTYASVLHELPLPSLATIDFSWFGPASTCGGVASGETFPSKQSETRPQILFSRRDPAEPLPSPAEGPPLLLVAMYAWDGNSYPGNEYWFGSLAASGDPAAACCSTITVLQNPDVNPERMCGAAAVVYGPLPSDSAGLPAAAAR